VQYVYRLDICQDDIHIAALPINCPLPIKDEGCP
jgi:hypothetical protein